jgi:dTDP-L-rhamnose 4-epimerase
MSGSPGDDDGLARPERATSAIPLEPVPARPRVDEGGLVRMLEVAARLEAEFLGDPDERPRIPHGQIRRRQLDDLGAAAEPAVVSGPAAAAGEHQRQHGEGQHPERSPSVGVVLVTGGCGFVGSHVVDALVERGESVRVLDLIHPLSHDGEPDYLNPAAEHVFGDVLDPALVARCLDGVEAVSHQAAMVGLGADFGDVVDYVRHNDLGTATLLRELARRTQPARLVLASSMVVYGEGRYRCGEHGLVRPAPRERERLARGEFEPPCPRCGSPLVPEAVPEEAAIDPRNVYAATKAQQEQLCSAFARETAAAVTALRYHNVYGPRMPRDTPYAGVASSFRSALENGRAPTVFEDGRQLRDFVHVRDVAAANVLALDAPATGAFNVASGEPHTVGELARELAAVFGGGEPETTGEYRLGDVRHVFASTERAAAELGFRAAVSFADGVGEFATARLR